MEKKVLNQEEINKLKEYQSNFNLVVNSLGSIEFKIQNLLLDKEDLKKSLIELRIQEKSILDKIKEKYGEGSIDIESGEFLPY